MDSPGIFESDSAWLGWDVDSTSWAGMWRKEDGGGMAAGFGEAR